MSLTTQYPCPTCAYAYTRTTETNRARSGTEARRKRVCLQCKAGFVTYEINAADYAMMQTMRQWIRANPPTCEAIERNAA